ncbi:MAG: response regulator [Gemmatimonadota bacterium]|nr:MAG: response regulator [Gemmatimonadota bacterium]
MTWSPLDVGDDSPLGFALPAPEDTPITLVDDEPSVLSALGRVLQREGYPVDTFESAEKALERIKRGGVALLISDLVMPEIGGMEAVRRALEEDPNLAVIILTGAADKKTAVESLRLGVDDYLEKPITADALIESVGRVLRRRAQDDYRRKLETWLRNEVSRRTEEVQRYSQQLESVSVATLSTLIRAMEGKDQYMKGHSERVSKLCERMGQVLGLEKGEVADLRTAGLLHDVGMIAVPESIMHKQGPLNDVEYSKVREHVAIAAQILEPLPHLARALGFVRSHHERLNGSGYPTGLRGSDFTIGGQVVAVAEVYASLTEERAHRPAHSPVEALETLQGSQDIWFEGRAVAALVMALKQDPQLKR